MPSATAHIDDLSPGLTREELIELFGDQPEPNRAAQALVVLDERVGQLAIGIITSTNRCLLSPARPYGEHQPVDGSGCVPRGRSARCRL